MPQHALADSTARFAVMLLMAAVAGCTISIQPWTKQPPPPATPPYPDAGPWNANMRNGMPPQQNAPANNEERAPMIKTLNEEQDLRKAMTDRVESLKKRLKEREDSLRLTSFEIDETTKQIKRAREDFRQVQTETEEFANASASSRTIAPASNR